MGTTPAHTLNLSGVLSESKRILKAHARHFHALTFLFLLPLSFSLIIYPTLHLSIIHSDVVSTQTSVLKSPPIHQQTLVFHLLYTIIVFLLSICSLATITYTTYHGFSGTPVKFFSAIKSLLFSFFPLVSTAIAAQFLLFLISLTLLSLVGVVIKLGQNLGFVIDYNSNYFTWFYALVGAALCLITIYFHVNWALAPVIVVAESKWGFEPLRRSSYLLKGMRSISFSLLLFFGILVGFWVWLYSGSVLNFEINDGWISLGFIGQTIFASSFLTLFLLHNIAAHTVLYMYCKALHGELAIDIADEFSHQYISLPFDHEKVPQIVLWLQLDDPEVGEFFTNRCLLG